MEPKPVRESREPAYPTRREVLAGAASLALVNLTGCSFVFADSEAGGPIIAPVFEHGEGRGATGCVVVSPPVFLSEEEAMQVIREELAKHGVQLKAGGTLEDVRVPARTIKLEAVDKGNGTRGYRESVVEVPDSAKPLKLNGIDADKKIAVEFVSCQHYHDLGGISSFSTVQEYDFKGVAERIAAEVKKQGKAHVFLGMFYDPSSKIDRIVKKEGKVDWPATWKEASEKGTEESKKLLRQQVKDFAAWLKEQKAIQ